MKTPRNDLFFARWFGTSVFYTKPVAPQELIGQMTRQQTLRPGLPALLWTSGCARGRRLEMLKRIGARLSHLGFKQVRRLVVAVVGTTVLLFGVALLVLPGPAVLVIPAGLAILGLEFRWARRLLRRAKQMIRSSATHLNRDRRRPTGNPQPLAK
jgi:tellurite resistance protein TerC